MEHRYIWIHLQYQKPYIYFPVRYYVFIVCLFGWTNSSPNICDNHRKYDRIRDYSDCSKYFECIEGTPINRSCERGNKFDPNLRVCSPDQFECFECPADAFFVDLPVDYECAQFVRCIDGIATHHVCGSGLLFDPILKKCNKRKDVVCLCPDVDLPGHPLFVRDWTDCAK